MHRVLGRAPPGGAEADQGHRRERYDEDRERDRVYVAHRCTCPPPDGPLSSEGVAKPTVTGRIVSAPRVPGPVPQRMDSAIATSQGV